MKKELLNKIDWILPLVFSILFFLLVKEILPSFIYVLLACIAGLYYFPYRIFNQLNNLNGNQEKLLFCLSCYLFSFIIAMSILNYYIPDNTTVRTIAAVTSIANVAGLIYYLAKEDKQMALTYFCFCVLSSGIFALSI